MRSLSSLEARFVEAANLVEQYRQVIFHRRTTKEIIAAETIFRNLAVQFEGRNLAM
jgi:hypothetical protein